MTYCTIRFSYAMNCIIIERGSRIHYYAEGDPHPFESMLRTLQYYARAEGDEAQAEADKRIPIEEFLRMKKRFEDEGGRVTRPGKKSLDDLEI